MFRQLIRLNTTMKNVRKMNSNSVADHFRENGIHYTMTAPALTIGMCCSAYYAGNTMEKNSKTKQDVVLSTMNVITDAVIGMVFGCCIGMFWPLSIPAMIIQYDANNNIAKNIELESNRFA